MDVVLTLVLPGFNLRHPHCVGKLEKIFLLCFQEKLLSSEDMDNIWASQEGVHESVVKNTCDLLARMAWDLSPEDLDRLFVCFQVKGSRKERSNE